MFIEPDEHIIIMEDDVYFPFNDDDIKMIVDAGIKTVQVPHALMWDGNTFIDPDKHIEKYLNTDLKLILPFFFTTHHPEFTSYIQIDETLNLLVLQLAEHFHDILPRIQFTFAIPEGGEFLWGTMKTFPMSDESIAEFIINRQRLLVTQHNEIWLYLHNFLGGEDNWNGKHLPSLYEALRNRFPDVPIYSVQYAHFAVGGSSITNYECQSLVKTYKDKFGIKFFVGSEYCEGLDINFDRAIEQKVYGFLTAPLHSENPIKHIHMETWMIDKLREANRKFNDSYKI